VENSDAANVSNADLLQIVARLLDVDEADAERTLCVRVVAARGEVMQKGHTVEEAMHGRDAFAKASCVAD
jgi:myosin-1